MASIDVPVALLGYGTVGAAVNRLLVESADDIERATGHRLRVVKALVRDVEKHRGFPAAAGVLTNDFASIADDDSIAVVAEVMGGVEPAGAYVSELLSRGKSVVSANKQLVAQAWRRALRGGVRRRRPAPLRGQRLRGDPGDQGAARGAGRDERAPRARHRQRHDQLHPHRDGGRGVVRRGACRGAAARVRRGRSDGRRDRRRRGGEDGDPRDRGLPFTRRARRRRVRRDREDHRARHQGGGRARHGRSPRRQREPDRRAASTSASIPPSSTGTTRWRRSKARSTP